MTRALSSLPLSTNSQQQRLCQGGYCDELAFRIPSAGYSFRPDWTRLPAKVDGASDFLHALQSPMPSMSPVFAIEHGDDGHGIH